MSIHKAKAIVGRQVLKGLYIRGKELKAFLVLDKNAPNDVQGELYLLDTIRLVTIDEQVKITAL